MLKKLAGGVGVQEVSNLSRGEPGRVKRSHGSGRVWSGQEASESHGWGRVGSGRVGSGRVGSGRVGSGWVTSDRVGSGRVGSP